MKIYKTTRKVEQFEIDENKFFNWLKKKYPEDRDIKDLNSIEELKKEFGGISEFSEELEQYLIFMENKDESKILDKSSTFYDNYEKAYDDKEWGVH